MKEILLLVLLLASPSESQSWEPEGCNRASIRISALISGHNLFL